MSITTIDITTTDPLSHPEAMELFAVELDRTIEMLAALDPEGWSAQTECPDWDVRRLYLHVLGACEAGASMKENAHQMMAAKRHRKRHGGPLEAGLSFVQVHERLELDPTEILDRLTTIAPTTVRKRSSTPRLMRRMKMSIDGPVVEKWTLGYLIDTIYLRDLWLHRVDTSRATGSEMVLTADHDGRIVADVAAEWARRHGRPCTLELIGPAGGAFVSAGIGTDVGAPTHIELDAVEFCRSVGGRREATGLLATVVPF